MGHLMQRHVNPLDRNNMKAINPARHDLVIKTYDFKDPWTNIVISVRRARRSPAESHHCPHVH